MINPQPPANIDPLVRWRLILRAAVANGDAAAWSDFNSSPAGSHGSPRRVAVGVLAALHGTADPAIALDADLAILDALPLPAARGSEVVAAVWTAYLNASRGDTGAADQLDRATARLLPTALLAGADDNPEPWWAAELMILHAMRSHAWRRPNAASEAAIARCVAFHLAEIQPDHATNEPWAIHAFAATDAGKLTAETLLHAAMVQGAGVLTPAARLIVIDALHAIEAGAAGQTTADF